MRRSVSTEEAWFFLDSVDEAQLETPRALEDAVRIFGTRCHAALDRAHGHSSGERRCGRCSRCPVGRKDAADVARRAAAALVRAVGQYCLFGRNPALDAHLASMPLQEASAFAQQFVVALLGGRGGTVMRAGSYRNARDLKTLYILMHRYMRAAEDIDRAGKGVYSPTLRDHAQDGRSTLFNMLVEVSGPDAYAAMKAFEEEHPEHEYRRWMAVRARQRATQDADEPLWSIERMRDIAKVESSDQRK